MLSGRNTELPPSSYIRDTAGDALAHLGIGKPAEARLHVIP